MNSWSKLVSALAALGLLTVAFVAIAAITLGPVTHGTTSTATSPVAMEDASQAAHATRSTRPMAQASYLGFDGLSSLAAKADTIAKGKVLSQQAERLNISEGANREADPTYVDCVVVEFKVMRAIKGPIHKNEIITVAYLAGEDIPGLQNNASSIVFLNRTEAGPYMPLNPAQAVVRIENGKVKADKRSLLVDDGTDEDDVVRQIEQ